MGEEGVRTGWGGRGSKDTEQIGVIQLSNFRALGFADVRGRVYRDRIS